MTVLMPRAFSFSSRFEPRNLSGPFWRAHSPSRGINPGSITSAGVALPSLPTRLYHTIAPAVRAAAWSRLTLGTVATQRGRAPQLAFIISRMRRAVVEPSSVTGLSSGAGGGFTVAQSLRISAVEDDAANAIMSTPAAAAAPRNRVRMSNIVSSFGFIGSLRFQLYLSAKPYACRPLVSISDRPSRGWVAGCPGLCARKCVGLLSDFIGACQSFQKRREPAIVRGTIAPLIFQVLAEHRL